MPHEAENRGAHLPPSMKRHRITSLVIVAAVIGLGLASRRIDVVHAWLGKYPGDALWTVMVYFLMALVSPSTSPIKLGVAALAVSWAVEFSQLLRYPWLDAFRSTTIGHLMLGSRFDAPDLIAYAVGVVLAMLVDASRMAYRKRVS
jgi:hypothetical protein